MDKSTQKEVGRLAKFTKRQRHEYVDKMIAARLRGRLIINSFERMPNPPLELKKRDKKATLTMGSILRIKGRPWLNTEEAELYFNHLVSIATKAADADDRQVWEGVHTMDEAYEQLFIALNQMRPDIEIQEDIFGDIENTLDELKKRMDNRDNKTEQTLRLILRWQKSHDQAHRRDKRKFNEIVQKR